MGRGTGFFGNADGRRGGCGIQAFIALALAGANIYVYVALLVSLVAQ